MLVKEGIINEDNYSFWSLPVFSSIEEDDTLVELFAQEQETPVVYNGEMLDITIYLGSFSCSPLGYERFAVQLIRNYVKNVGGEIKAIKTKNSSGGWGKTAQIAIPKDAPYCSNLKKTYDHFLDQSDKIIARYKLRHEVNKQLPYHRKEAKYIKNRMDDRCGISFRATIAIMLVALFLEILFL